MTGKIPHGMIMKLFQSILTGWVLLSVLTLLAAGGSTSPPQSADPAQKKVYKSRELGDLAFKDRVYNLAISFYRQYLRDAGNDPAALQDAYERLISACIDSGDAASAETELKKYKQQVKSAPATQINRFQAGIELLRGKYIDAAEIYRKVLSGMKPGNPALPQVLYNLGYAYTQLGKWDVALKEYERLVALDDKSPWTPLAMEQQIFVLIMKGDAAGAAVLLKKLKKNAPKEMAGDLKLLTALTGLKTGKFSQAETAYNEFRKDARNETYPLAYITAMQFADIFGKRKKDSKLAQQYIKDAFEFAPGANERRNALKLLIENYISNNEKPAAVSTVEKYLEFYPDSDDANRMKLLLVKILFELKQPEKAEKVYKGMLADKKLPDPEKITAAKHLINLLVEKKDYSRAEQVLVQLRNSVSSKSARGEAELLSAKLYYQRKNYSLAAPAFINVANNYPALRENALSLAMFSFIELKEFNKALSAADILLKDFPKGENYQETRYFHAQILEKLGDLDHARKEFIQFAKKYPNHEYASLALFEAAYISYLRHEHIMADQYFTEFIQKYQSSPLLPRALYRRIHTRYSMRKDQDAIKDVQTLKEKFPKSPITAAAMFWLVDHYRENGANDMAQTVLREIIEKFAADKEIPGQALYDLAYISNRIGKDKEAVVAIQEIYKKYPDTKAVSEAMFLHGDILSSQGNFKNALTFYLKSAERRPGSPLETACWGRIGDCNYSLYTKDFDKKHLIEAVSYYKKILKKADISPLIREQSLFKQGKSYERLNKDEEALENYLKLIYNYEREMKTGMNPNPLWMNKGAKAAISIYMERNKPEEALKAIKIYRKLIDLGDPLSDEYKKIIANIRQRYKI